MLIAREADRVQLATADESDIQRERRRLHQLAGGQARMERLMAALSVEPQEIEAIVRRRALMASFLEANLEGSQTVSEAEVERVFESGEHPFLGRSLDEVREPMRVWLGRQALTAAVRRWVTVLRGRVTVKWLAPYPANTPRPSSESIVDE